MNKYQMHLQERSQEFAIKLGMMFPAFGKFFNILQKITNFSHMYEHA